MQLPLGSVPIYEAPALCKRQRSAQAARNLPTFVRVQPPTDQVCDNCLVVGQVDQGSVPALHFYIHKEPAHKGGRGLGVKRR